MRTLVGMRAQALEERLAGASDPELRRLVKRLGPQEGSRVYLERLRWPDGVRCPRCDSASVVRLRTRRKYNCASCKYQFRVTAGTRLHDSHVPGWKWLAAVELMLDERPPVTAVEVKELLGVGYTTAGFLAQRIREALVPLANDDKATRAKHPRYATAYAAEIHWRESGGTRAGRFRHAALALIAAEPLAYRVLVSRPG